MSPEELLAFARSIFDAQPFSQFLGAELAAVGPDSAEILIRNRPEIRQQHGFVHGGVVSYLADNALTFAGGLALGGDALTAEFKINYGRPAIGELMVARARAAIITQRQARVPVLGLCGGGRHRTPHRGRSGNHRGSRP